MALNPEVEFPGKINPSDANYTYGSARNITTPSDGTGTPLVANLVNDIFGWQQALLNAAGIVPTNSPETAILSQYLESMFTIAPRVLLDIAALRATEPTQNQQAVFILGHTVKGIGGGLFYFDQTDAVTADDDGYTVVTPGLARWKRIDAGVVRPVFYGVDNVADSLAKLDAAILFAFNSGRPFDWSGTDARISGPLNIPANVVMRASEASTLRPFGGYTGDAIIVGAGDCAITGLPRIFDFTTGTHLTFFGTDAGDVNLPESRNAFRHIKFKTDVGGSADENNMTNLRVWGNTLQGAATGRGVVFESNNEANIMRGLVAEFGECNNVLETVVYDDLALHGAIGAWSGNTVRFGAVNPTGLANSKLIRNLSTFALPRNRLIVDRPVTGFDTGTPIFLDGIFNANQFEYFSGQIITRTMMANFQGGSNIVKNMSNMNKSNTPITLLAASNPAGFNGGTHLYQGRSFVEISTPAAIAPGATATYYAYHVHLGGTANRGQADSPIEITLANAQTDAISLDAQSNSAAVENEIIIKVTNTGLAAIPITTTIQFWLDVE